MNRKDLHEYQLDAIDFLRDTPRAAVFADMGTGKSIITLTALSNDARKLPALVITTKRVAELVWEQEAALWEHTRHLTFSKVLGTAIERTAALAEDTDIYLMNIENTQWLMDHMSRIPMPWFHTLVLDELSLWRGGGKRWKALIPFSRNISNLIALTGTPAPNGLLQLWPQMELVKAGVLGRNKTRYRATYFYPTDFQQYNWEVIPDGREAILEKISPYVTRISNDELDMPEFVINRVPVALPPGVIKMGKDLMREGIIEIAHQEIVAESAAVACGKLQQLGQGRIYFGGDDVRPGIVNVHHNKLDALEEVVDDLQGANVLIAYRYKHDLAALRSVFPRAEHLGAGVGAQKAEEIVKAWNEGFINVLLIHPDSAGHGLNIQGGGHHLIWYGLTWDLDKFDQLNARIYRQGQKASTVFIHLLIAGEMDRVIANALVSKHSVQDAVLAYFEAENLPPKAE